MSKEGYKTLLEGADIQPGFREIAEKVIDQKRLTPEEGLYLFEKANLALLGSLANVVKERKHGKKAFFIRNFHIEPTNICIYNCKFCSYAHHKSGETWEFSMDEMLEKVNAAPEDMCELHITGGVHPKLDLGFFSTLLQKIRELRPGLHMKAYSAIELDYMFEEAGVSIEKGLKILKDSGLDSIPGGGAEIFDTEIREQICDDKAFGKKWLEVHEVAHGLGIGSNATILYGHIENYAHRIHHLETLRQLQDRTGGFNTFIPLKFKSANNEMSHLGEVNAIEDMRNYAVSRIYLDNFPHIKAYWPMIGKQMSQLSLSFGVDDLDGTINDSTQIYSLAGADDKNPIINTDGLVKLIKDAGCRPVERDSWYREVRVY
ncbi:MAG: aminofutalosine synthase MqnE [Bacteroidetes bacterium 4484_276]|nr:MAG: aminofutalosine synthase MqnE [Bacteroidetes bacterium 4484_276]